MHYTITPLHLGTLTVDQSGLTLRKGAGTRLAVPCLGYLVRGGDKPILVDSGPCQDPDWGTRYHNPFTRTAEQSLVAALSRVDVDPADIETVIISHLHWDHCYGNVHLPCARFVVQRAELAYAIAPLPCDAPIYETQLHPVHFLKTLERFELIDGEREIAPGVRCIPLPGHTPGLQGVLVETAAGPFLIASDHCPLFANFDQRIPTGLIHDLEAWYRSTARIAALGARVLPGHDMQVLERASYP
ncbi:MAG TPA: N-acyl homoserine lactonase family protein [Casimicrobiaceae bacterium]|nr:N-acyl homoserine lactonase family protein [Casimicrobiaceae bacterium]